MPAEKVVYTVRKTEPAMAGFEKFAKQFLLLLLFTKTRNLLWAHLEDSK